MPTYDYECPANQQIVEVMHPISARVENWGQLCEWLGVDPGDTSPGAPVYKCISAPGLAFPKTNTELKNMGFTKLVRRDSGVYENVTAGQKESRIMKADQPSTYPNFKKKLGD